MKGRFIINQEIFRATCKQTIKLLRASYGFLVASSIALLLSLLGGVFETVQNTLERGYYFESGITQNKFDSIYHNDLSNTFKYGLILLVGALILFVILLFFQREYKPVTRRLGWALIIIVMGGIMFTQTLANVYSNHSQGINYYHPERMYKNNKGGK